MSPAAATLLVVGGVLQFLGIVALAWPDLIPWGERLARWMTDIERRAENRIRRLLRRPSRVHHLTMSADAKVSVSMSGAATVSKADSASIEEKVAFLLRRDQETQQFENRTAARLDRLEEESQKRLDELRAELKGHFEDRITEALALYRALRQAGAVLLAVGLICSIVAGFV